MNIIVIFMEEDEDLRPCFLCPCLIVRKVGRYAVMQFIFICFLLSGNV